jgi:hypothetical protein
MTPGTALYTLHIGYLDVYKQEFTNVKTSYFGGGNTQRIRHAENRAAAQAIGGASVGRWNSSLCPRNSSRRWCWYAGAKENALSSCQSRNGPKSNRCLFYTSHKSNIGQPTVCETLFVPTLAEWNGTEARDELENGSPATRSSSGFDNLLSCLKLVVSRAGLEPATR